MAIRKVFADNAEESWCVVQTPGVIVIKASEFAFGRKDGHGCVIAIGEVTMDFGELGIATSQRFEMKLELPKKETP